MRILALILLLCWQCTAEPRRIVSTAPGITEILFALGLGNKIVGATQYCVYPPEARKIPRTGSWVAPNLEAVLAVKPDLVIVQRTAIHNASKFDSLRLRTLEIELLGVADIYTAIEKIGAAAEVPGRASQLVAEIRRSLAAVQKQVASRPRTPAMFVVGRSPGTLEGIVAVGKSSYQDEVMNLAGGRNILEDSPAPYPKVLVEEILARDPAVIIDMGDHADAEQLSEPIRRAEIALWFSRFPKLRAVRERRVFPVSSGVYVVPGPRVVELAREFARFLHPETFH